jgi:HlyD family secretion protein
MKKESPYFDITTYSEEVQDVMHAEPKKILRMGVKVICIGFIAALLITWFIRYPDFVKGDFILSSSNASVSIGPKSSGKITLFTSERDTVEKGKIIAYIENACSYPEYKRLRSLDSSIRSMLFSGGFRNVEKLPELNIGPLQDAYASLSRSIDEYIELNRDRSQMEKLRAAKDQLDYLSSITDKIRTQKEINESAIALLQKKLDRDSFLLSEKVISAQDYETSLSSTLSPKLSGQSIDQSLLSNELRLAELRSRYEEYKLETIKLSSQLESTIKANYFMLTARIGEWENNYLLVAPIAGIVSFTNIIYNNQTVNNTSAILSIVPEYKDVFGYVYIPADKIGEIKLGQEVTVKMFSFPSENYGYLTAHISEMSLVPNEDKYLLKVNLDHELKTTAGYDIDFMENQKGVAEIMINNMRLIQRLFVGFKKSVKT